MGVVSVMIFIWNLFALLIYRISDFTNNYSLVAGLQFQCTLQLENIGVRLLAARDLYCVQTSLINFSRHNLALGSLAFLTLYSQ